MGSALDKMMSETTEQQPRTLEVVNVIRQLATNKDVKAFLTAVNRYSKTDLAKFKTSCRNAYHVFQSSMLVKNDSALANELKRYPYLCVFFERMENE